jgi:hypothetical protein
MNMAASCVSALNGQEGKITYYKFFKEFCKLHVKLFS